MLLETEPQLVENTHSLAKILIPGIYVTISRQTAFGPVLRVHIKRYLDISGIEIQIPSTTTQERTSWVVTCREKNRHVDELPLNGPDHNPTSSELLLEGSGATESEPCSTEMEQSSIEETRAKQFEIQTDSVYNYPEEVTPIEERKWNDIPAYKRFQRKFFRSRSLKIGHEIGTLF